MERHHIIPTCMDGSNQDSNLVWLTAEEHYLAHLLLVKIYPGNHKLLWAVTCMTGATATHIGRGNKLYGWVRKRFAERVGRRNKGRIYSDAQKEQMRQRMLGSKRGKYKPRVSDSPLKDRPKSDQHRAAMSAAAKRRKRPTMETASQRQRQQIVAMRALSTDRSFTHEADYKKARRDQMLKVWADRKAGTRPMPSHLVKEL